MGNGKGVALPFLGGTCGPLSDPCGHPEPPRRDADEALEVTGELALERARSGPTHRLQRLPKALSRPDQVQRCDISFLSERMSPSTRERAHMSRDVNRFA